MNYTLEILKIGFYLILIIGVLYFLSKFLKNNILNMQTSKYLKVIDKMYLGTKSGLFLIEINDEIFLISQSEKSFQKLEKWNKKEFNLTNIEENNYTKKSFKKFFKEHLGRKESDSNQK